ncbi:DUF3109 family protein [Cobetia amphilecti]|uniref:DUF3109 family protein n=1 Tax=Cobetia amphilecti TaxID=1055104 RepID=UPI0036EFEBCA
MIQIENVLVSDDVVEAKFVCDLHKCKGGCCEDGDAGARDRGPHRHGQIEQQRDAADRA